MSGKYSPFNNLQYMANMLGQGRIPYTNFKGKEFDLGNELRYIQNSSAPYGVQKYGTKPKTVFETMYQPGRVYGDPNAFNPRLKDQLDRDERTGYVPPRPVSTENGALTTNTQMRPAAVDPATQLPASAEQTMIDPTAFALQVYGQGQQAMKGKQSMDAVRNLGLAIHRQKYPEMYEPRGVMSVDPKTRATFPDGQTMSLENFTKEGYVTAPYTMIDNEATSALISNDTTAYSDNFAYANMSPQEKVEMAFADDLNTKVQEQIAIDDVASRIAEVEKMLADIKAKAK